jgi:threonine aldolase
MSVNLLSDTVTRPTPAMLEAMMRAEVGDDVFCQDPTVNALEARLARMFGQEAGLFCPSGTMCNQLAMALHTRPLDEVLCEIDSHVYQYEAAAYAQHAGVGMNLIQGEYGKLKPGQIRQAVRPRADWLANSRLLVLENTCNKGGGSIYTLSELEVLTAEARELELSLHLDGARLFNALVETGDAPEQVGVLFDSVSICLSKGLGAPVGSVLLGSREFITRARRLRKAFGGGMRQVGYLAAAGLYALDHHVERLRDDHARARALGEALEPLPWVTGIRPVQSNILIFDVKPEAGEVLKALEKEDIQAAAFGPNTIRFVTHLEIDDQQVDKTIGVLRKLAFTWAFLLAFFGLQAQTPLGGIINQYAEVLAIDTCRARVVLSDASAFEPGTQLILLQMQGVQIDETNTASFGQLLNWNSAGLYERAEVEQRLGDTLVLAHRLHNLYQPGIGRVQAVTLPVYEDAIVTQALTAQAWNGSTGGVLALEVTGTLSLGADIVLDGLGFRGGVLNPLPGNCQWFLNYSAYYYESGNWRGALKGEGLAAWITGKEGGRGAQLNGGGGGNDHNSGGGGGSHATAGGTAGNGVPPSAFGCSGPFPGVGGRALTPDSTRLILGGGGGAGHADNPGTGSAGGHGGGILILKAGTVQGNGFRIRANGQNAASAAGDGGGGGGAGGSLILLADAIYNTLLEARGGKGGNTLNPSDRCYGPGGGGSGGRLLSNLHLSLNPNLSGGDFGVNTVASSACPAQNSGAQAGASGLKAALHTLPMGTLTPSLGPPIANFQASVDGLVLTLTNNSFDADAFLWNLGDGSTSTAPTPMHSYAQPGSYTVTLVVSNACGTNSFSLNIQVGDPPTAAFGYNFQGGCAPLLITFQSQVSGELDSLRWLFPGGQPATSTSASPQVIYQTAGQFDVSLIAYGPGGIDTLTQAQLIQIVEAPVALFEVALDGLTASFNNLSSGSIANISWNFGDGNTLQQVPNPVHEYPAPGLYAITLTASNSFCASVFTLEINILPTSAKEQMAFPGRLFPNPTSGTFWLDWPEDGPWQLRLLDAQGRIHHHQLLPGSGRYPLQAPAPGMYWVELRKGDVRWAKPVMSYEL